MRGFGRLGSICVVVQVFSLLSLTEQNLSIAAPVVPGAWTDWRCRWYRKTLVATWHRWRYYQCIDDYL